MTAAETSQATTEILPRDLRPGHVVKGFWVNGHRQDLTVARTEKLAGHRGSHRHLPQATRYVVWFEEDTAPRTLVPRDRVSVTAASYFASKESR